LPYPNFGLISYQQCTQCDLHTTISETTMISARTASKQPRKNANSVASPGRDPSPPGDSNQNKNSRSPLMSRLAVGIEPPGSFWKKPRNSIKQCRNKWKTCNFNQPRHSTIYMYLKHQKQLPLPGFLAKFKFLCVSLHKNLPSLCFPLQPT